MIAMADDKSSQDKLLELCDNSPFGCKIASYALAYGFDKRFSCFWTDENEDAVYCMIDNLLIISGTVTDIAEAKEFIKVIGVTEVMCAVRNADALGLSSSENGDVLIKQLSGNADFTESYSHDDLSIRDVFFLLEETGMTDEFEAFYLDLSHKLRHNGAIVLTEYENNELIGCLLVSAITDNAAIISAVAVSEEHRGKGIGTKLIKAAEEYLGGRTVYIFKEKNKNEQFYKGLDYVKKDTWITAKI